MRFRIIVTDVTDYGSKHHCVAGWDTLGKRMVRPEPAPQQFWSKSFVGPKSVFWPGHVVEFEADIPTNQPYPHATEDVVVRSDSLPETTDKDRWALAKAVRDSISASLDVLFGGKMLRQNRSAYIPVGSKSRSLGAVEISRKDLQFSQRGWDGRPPKLRAAIAKERLDLGVTSTILRRTFSTGGVEAVEQLLSKAAKLHLRIGLARPFQD